jgi:hypothetical protein
MRVALSKKPRYEFDKMYCTDVLELDCVFENSAGSAEQIVAYLYARQTTPGPLTGSMQKLLLP